MDVMGQFIEGIWNYPPTRLACCIVPAIVMLAYFAAQLQRLQRERERVATILSHKDEWEEDICQSLINRRIGIDMTEEMVRLAWGKPSRIENKELTRRGQKTRWIYGQPRKGANYVWFTNGKVTKIQQ